MPQNRTNKAGGEHAAFGAWAQAQAVSVPAHTQGLPHKANFSYLYEAKFLCLFFEIGLFMRPRLTSNWYPSCFLFHIILGIL